MKTADGCWEYRQQLSGYCVPIEYEIQYPVKKVCKFSARLDKQAGLEYNTRQMIFLENREIKKQRRFFC